MTKTVALSDDAYEALARLKRPGQSFSELVKEIVAQRRPRIRDVAGTLADDSDYWMRYAATRREARAVARRRVDLEE